MLMTKDSILLVIGASAGGNAVLPNLISQLDPDMKISVMVVMHLSRASIGELLLKRIQGHTSLSCTMPSNGDPLKDGHLYLAVPNHHLLVKKGKVLVGNGPMENRYRPSIDALFPQPL